MLQNHFSQFEFEAGCDEAGRGCLAGPVFAAAVILPIGFRNDMLNDSKQLSEKKRLILRDVIMNEALTFGVAKLDAGEIDAINILNASIAGMHKALDLLKIEPQFIIVDGNRFKKYRHIPHQTQVKGDARFASIAAASILAKTFRDDYMVNLHNEYPCYNWKQNKGYPTADHRAAITKHGISPYHRKSFKLTDTQLKLAF